MLSVPLRRGQGDDDCLRNLHALNLSLLLKLKNILNYHPLHIWQVFHYLTIRKPKRGEAKLSQILIALLVFFGFEVVGVAVSFDDQL